MRRLIINADDFGLTSGVNKAIIEAHQRGVISSATLMAGGSAFDEAVTLARENPQLSVGCHVVLVDGTPLSPSAQVSSLLAAAGSNQFNHSVQSLMLRAFRHELRPEHIFTETRVQIRKIQAAGISVSHIDTHKHAHVHPRILDPIMKAAKQCGIGALRNPVEPIPLLRIAAHPKLWKRCLEVSVTRTLTAKFRQSVERAGLATPEGTIGIVATGVLDNSLFASLIEHMPEGTWEFVCHPGYNDAELQSVRTRLRNSREQELRTLTSPTVQELLRRQGIELISYRQFTAEIAAAGR